MHIQRFIDKIAVAESKQNKDFVMPLADARGLRDELMKILAEYHQWHSTKPQDDIPVLTVEVKGGTFR
jgi:hypothetical protein